jgi:hypothetical protein
MAKKHFQAEQIIGKLREAEVEISNGHTIAQIVKKLGITEQTYYRCRKEYGRLRTARKRETRNRFFLAHLGPLNSVPSAANARVSPPGRNAFSAPSGEAKWS